jgi:hypothetical protein
MSQASQHSETLALDLNKYIFEFEILGQGVTPAAE